MFWSCDTIVPALALHDTNGVINGITVFLRSRQLNSDATLIFWLCDATTTGIICTNDIVSGTRQ